MNEETTEGETRRTLPDWLAHRRADFNTKSWPAPFDRPDDPSWVAGDDFLVVYDLTSPVVEVAGGRYRLPSLFDALVDRRGAIPKCQLRVAITPRGPVCEQLTLVGNRNRPLTSMRIRVPLRELMEEIVSAVGAFNLETERVDREGFVQAFKEDIVPHPEPGKRMTDDFLWVVADRYRYAMRFGPDQRRPTEAIAEAFDVSRSTAGRWLVEARKRGLLDPAAPGRAGEWAEEQEEDEDG